MTLTALPTEMVEAIASHLDLVDFHTLRLVCASLNKQSLHHFRERFFRKSTLAWNIASFHALLAIVRHPHFGSALHELVIDATPWHAIQIWERKKRLADSPGLDTEVGRYELREYNALKDRAEEVAKFWNETRFDQKTLISIFEKKRTLQSITFAYDGMDKKYGKFGRQYCESSQNEMSRPFVATMTAIATSGIVIHEISTHTTRKYGAVSIGRLESLSRYLSHFDTQFEHLQILKLNLRDWRYPEEGFEPPPGKAAFIVRFLAKCKNIRTFEVSCFSSLELDLFSDMSRHCQFGLMENCKLELFQLSSMDDLFDFLAPAKGTLRSLSLSHVVLRDGMATWSDFMRRIASDVDLDSVELMNLFERMGARVGLDGTLKGSIVLTGSDVKDKLEYHAEHLVQGNWGPAFHLASVAYPFIGMRT